MIKEMLSILVMITVVGCSSSRSMSDLERENEILLTHRDMVNEHLRERRGREALKERESKEWFENKGNATPGIVHVRSSGIVWQYKNPPFTGTGHGDGIASFEFTGAVVSAVTKEPMTEVRIIELPSNQFGGVRKETEVSVTGADGKFKINASVGAAIQMGGATPGAIYQSRNKKYKITHFGHKTFEIEIGYGCPELRIHLLE